MPKVVYHDSDGVDKVINLGADPLLIGRATECQIQTQDAMVSRRHARIVWDGNYWIEDLGSSNGVYVGHEKVQRAPFRPGDTVTCGSLVLRLLPDAAPRAEVVSAPAPEAPVKRIDATLMPDAMIQPVESEPRRGVARPEPRAERARAVTEPPPPPIRMPPTEPVEVAPLPAAPRIDPKVADGMILLGDSLAALRASLRNANGEATLLKEPDEAAQGVREALKSAAEQLESARAQLRSLAKLLGL
jgi:predicted component of type VI protein secretion system